MDIIENLKSCSEESINEQYGVKTIPVELARIDIKINEMLDYWIGLSKDDKEIISLYISEDIAWLLMCFGIRMATYSLRLSNQRYFTNGLLAIGMTLGILDIRDIWVVLPLYCDAQKKTGLSFDEILDQDIKFASTLRNFIGRDEENKTLKCMGYVIGYEYDNPTYMRTW